MFGDRITLLALPLVAVLTLRASAAEMGALTAMSWAPSLLSPFIGAWIDRREHRRRMMIAADLARAVIILSVPVGAILGALSMAHLYTVAFAMGILTVLFDLSSMTYFLAVVDREDVLDAGGKLSISRTFADVAGPGIGGVLVETLTAPIAVIADALSFLVSAMFLRRIKARELPVESHPEGGPRLWGRIAEGFRFLKRHPLLRPGLGCAATVNFFNLMMHALYVLYLTRELGLSAGLIGAILSAGALGGFLGAFVAPRVGQRLGPGPSTLLGCVLFTAPLVLIPLAAGPTGVVVATLTVAEVLSTIGVMIFDVNLMNLKLVVTPHALRARIYGAWRAVNFGVRPVGALAGGVIGTAIGLRPTLWIATLGAVAGAIWVWLSPLRSLRSLRSIPPEGQDSPVYPEF